MSKILTPKRWSKPASIAFSLLFIAIMCFALLPSPVQIGPLSFGGAGVARADTWSNSTAGTYYWICPANVYTVQVEVRAGGGGGAGYPANLYGGAGGGGGAYSKATISVTPGGNYTVIVGAGGVGGGGGANGGLGGDSSFGNASTVMAKGGTGGTSASPYTAGVGGAAASGVGSTKWSGGNGAVGGSYTIGAGGGGAGDAANGGNAVTTTGGAGGSAGGGAGGDQVTAGTAPGGGGGGGYENIANGWYWAGKDGAAGSVLLTYTASTVPLLHTDAATSITAIAATLNGEVTATGGSDVTVTVYWGDNDGGNVTGNWDNSSAPTSPAQPQGIAAFYKDITGLSSHTTYFFTARGVNSTETTWASTLSFTTPTLITDFLYKKQPIFNTSATGANVAGNQSSFPVAVEINAASWATQSELDNFFSASNVNGKRIQFFDSDQTTNLDYEVKAYANDTLSLYGDSFTRGYYASTSLLGYAALLGTHYNWAIENYSVGGREVADSAVAAYSNQVSTTGKSAALVGVNDNAHWGTNAAALAENQSIAYAVAAWLSIPHANKITGQGAVTTSGTWTNSTYYGGTLGIWADATNEYVEFTVHGTVVYVGLTALNSATGGNYSITVDTVEKATGNCTFTKVPYWSGLTYSPFLVRISGLTDADHTVRVTVTSANKVQFDWAGGNEHTTNFFLGNCLYLATYAIGAPFDQGSDAGADAINTRLSTIASTLLGDGLKVHYVDAQTGWDTPAHFYEDNIHPNDAGHEHIYDAFVTAIDAATLTAENKEAIYWVRVPSVAGNSTIDSIWVAFGNDPTGVDQDNSTGVWDSSFKMVQHLADNSWGASPQAKDSTSNGNDGTDAGIAFTPSMKGMVGRGRDFDGASDSLTIGSTGFPSGAATRTISFWLNLDEITTDYQEFLMYGTNANYQAFQIMTGEHSVADNRHHIIVGIYGENFLVSTGALSVGTWAYVNVRVTGTKALTFTVDTTSNNATTTNALNTVLSLGYIGLGFVGNYPDCKMDEFRVSAGDRGADWTQLEYYSMAKTNYNGDNGVSAPFLSWGAATFQGDISNTPSSWSVGVVQPSQTYWPNGAEPGWPLGANDCWGNLTNNSLFAVDILASMTDMIGGTTWGIGSSPGNNIFTLKVGIAGLAGIGNFTTLSNTPVAWITSMAAGNMTRWTMVFYAPTNSPQFADGALKSGNMTFTAEAS